MGRRESVRINYFEESGWQSGFSGQDHKLRETNGIIPEMRLRRLKEEPSPDRMKYTAATSISATIQSLVCRGRGSAGKRSKPEPAAKDANGTSIRRKRAASCDACSRGSCMFITTPSSRHHSNGFSWFSTIQLISHSVETL